MPFGSPGSGAVGGGSVTGKKTPFNGFMTPTGIKEYRSCNPSNGPGAAPEIPGGYRLCARNPTVRVESALPINSGGRAPAVSGLEKNSAVRAFWTETSQLKTVASRVRKVPSTIGGVVELSGLFTTEMKTCAG